MKILMHRPIFATRQPLLTPGIQKVLMAADIFAEPRIVAPDDLEIALEGVSPRLVILDGQSLPGIDVLKRLCSDPDGSRIVIWTVHPTAALLQLAVECGVHGLLSSRLSLDEAADALARISRGERLLRFDPEPGPLELPEPLRLSSREQQMLVVLAEGATNACIANALHTTEGTVKVSLSRLYRKTGARNRQELIALGRTGALVAEETRAAVATASSFDAQWMLDESEPAEGEK